MSIADVAVRWRELGPIFVRGMQRTGTSIVGHALAALGIPSFGEGHTWFELLMLTAQFRDPRHWPDYRDASYALGEDRIDVLERYIAVALDEFHRDHLNPGENRWADKSPGLQAVLACPALAHAFPQARFVFTYRNGMATVHSGTRYWPQSPDIFDIMCQGWAETMSAWRKARRALPGRFLEIAQEEIASDPDATARRLAAFLGIEASAPVVAEVFRTERVVSAFPDRQPGNYRYKLNWTAEQRALFERICGPEMAEWGYDLDFRRPSKARRLGPAGVPA